MSKDTVFITGASGFVAIWIIKTLLEDGYHVIGSVRSEAKGRHVANYFSTKDFEYVIIKDLADQTAVDKMFQEHPEIKYVLHTASPFNLESKNPIEEVINPAINGVLSILKAVKK